MISDNNNIIISVLWFVLPPSGQKVLHISWKNKSEMITFRWVIILIFFFLQNTYINTEYLVFSNVDILTLHVDELMLFVSLV